MAYQNPNFDKKEYWKNRNNMVDVLDKEGKPVKENGKKLKEHKPLRGQGDSVKPLVMPDPNSKVEIGFDNHGQMVIKNRAFRRRSIQLPGNMEKTKPSRKRTNGKKNTFGKKMRRK